MKFLLGTRRYELGDAYDTIMVMERIVFLYRQRKTEEAHALAEETKQHIAASYDLSGRQYITVRLQEVMDILERAEKAK